ncbi:MAG: hypothetical protein AB7S75_05110 [Desulfococcaceae bacterium]
MDEILSDLSQSQTVFDEKSASFNDYKILSFIRELRAEISDLKNRQSREAENSPAPLHTENQDISKKTEEKFTALQTEILELRKHCADLKAEYGNIRKEHEGKITGLQNKIRDMENLKPEADEPGEKKKALRELLEILSASSNEAKKNVEELKNENRQLKDDSNRLRAGLEVLKNENQKIKDDLNKLEAKIDTIDSICKAYPYKNNVLFPKNEHHREQE